MNATGSEIVAGATSRVRFPGISSRAYEHPADRGALAVLRAVPGFDAVLKAVSGAFNERSERLAYLASAVRVGPTQYPELAELRDECVSILDVGLVPELYVFGDPQPNAFTIGMDRPFIAVSTGLVERLDTDGMRFAIGHEIGHVLSGHALYRTMLLRLIQLTQAVSSIPLGYWGLRAVITALKEWFRRSELSCDRAGLLCGQDPRAAMRVHALLAGVLDPQRVDVAAFVAQAREYEAVGDVRDSVLKILQVLDSTHPMAVVRAAELQRWAAGEQYRAILSGDYPKHVDDQDVPITEEARAAARAYRDDVAESADPLAKVIAALGGTVSDTAGSVRRWVRGEGPPAAGD